jgi:hypothetical protein
VEDGRAEAMQAEAVRTGVRKKLYMQKRYGQKAERRNAGRSRTDRSRKEAIHAKEVWEEDRKKLCTHGHKAMVLERSLRRNIHGAGIVKGH